MKTLLLIFAFCFGLTARSQTLDVSNHLVNVPLAKLKCGAISNYFYRAQANNFTNAAQQSTNWWFYPTSNIVTATIDNSNVVVDIFSFFGQQSCGKGTATLSNIFYPDDRFKMTVFWGTNVPNPPTNGEWTVLHLTGMRTNGP